MAFLYHGSQLFVNRLKPQNMHGDPGVPAAVFASRFRYFALAYCGRWSDRDLNQTIIISRRNGARMELLEMRPGAFDEIYKGVGGYLYTIMEVRKFKKRNRFESICTEEINYECCEKIDEVLEALKREERVTLVPWDPSSKRFATVVKRVVGRMQNMTAENQVQYLKWRLEGEVPTVVRRMIAAAVRSQFGRDLI